MTWVFFHEFFFHLDWLVSILNLFQSLENGPGYISFTSLGSVRIVKNCDLGLELERPRSKFFTIRTTKLANNIYILGHPPNSEQDLGSKLTNKRQRFLCTLHLHTFVGFPIKFWWRTIVCILQCFFKVALILRGCTAKANSSKTKVLHNILKVRIQAYVLRTSEGRSWICWGILLPVKNMATSEEKLLQLCSNRW